MDASQVTLTQDIDEARRFLDFMLEDGEGLTLQTFHDRDRSRKDVARVMHSGLDDNIAELSRLQRDGAGVFWMVNEGDGAGRQEANVTAVRYLFADTDGAPLAPLLTLPPHMVVQSSHGRYHVYWRVVDCPLDRFKPVQRAIAERFKTDKSVIDLPRVMRVPGFLHQKDTPFLVKIRDIGNIPPYTLDDVVTGLGLSEKPIIEKVLPAPVPGTAFDFGKARKAAWDAARRTHEDASSSRHGEVFNLGCHLFRDGLPAEDPVFEYALQEFASHMRPTDASGRPQGMDLAAERKTIRDGYQRAHRDQGEVPDISGILGSIAAASAAPAAASSAVGESEPRQRFCLAERTAAKLFVGTPPPVNWLLRGIFPLGVSALLASPPNVGKSFLALDLAAKVARRGGGDIPLVAFGALLAAHGRAVYVSAEDDEPEIHRRLWSLCGSEMPDRLHVLSLPDVGHFGIIEADPTTREYMPTAAWRDLAREVAALPDVKLIVLDTLQALTSGDTNTTQATQPLMNEATALARATGACVLLIHHVAKNKTAEIRTSQDAADAIRGSGAIIGSARAAYVLWPPSDGGRAVCDVLGKEYQEGCAAFGLVAKRYGDARRDMSVFVRDEHGILRDQTQAYRALSGGDGDAVRSGILSAIRKAWEAGVSFAASPSGHNGMHARRFEMPEVFHEKSRAWFEEQVGKTDLKELKPGERLVGVKNGQASELYAAPESKSMRGQHAPAEVQTMEWLMEKGVAKNETQAWEMVRSAREKTRSAFVMDYVAKNAMPGRERDTASMAEKVYDSLQGGGGAPSAPQPGTGNPSRPAVPGRTDPRIKSLIGIP